MKPNVRALRAELRIARRTWVGVNGQPLEELRRLLQRHKLSVALREIINLNGRWYITHSGLLQLAFRRRCTGIKTTLEESLSDPLAGRWVFKAVVSTDHGTKSFEGYGDADPSNVSMALRGAEMRIAETRAVNRALRKAYGIGLCSIEELSSLSDTAETSPVKSPSMGSDAPQRSNNGQPRLRDQLCLVIRRNNLDATLVKAYAAEFCGAPTVGEASRDSVESFIAHLATAAKRTATH